MEKYTFPIVKNYADDLDGRCRNKSISIFNTEEFCRNREEWVDGYDVIASHECWTGGEWLQITNKEFTTSFDRAVDIAKEMQSELYN